MNRRDLKTHPMKTLTPEEDKKSGECKTVTLSDEEWERYKNIKPDNRPVAIPFEYNRISIKQRVKMTKNLH